jgi:hypothetical protein
MLADVVHKHGYARDPASASVNMKHPKHGRPARAFIAGHPAVTKRIDLMSGELKLGA